MNEEWARGRILVMPRAGLPAQVFASILKEHDGKARKIGQSTDNLIPKRSLLLRDSKE
ncbi:hypothetical protein C8R30_1191 [Nitrosomonas nitrosa]|nr:hypothetical protein C8R30_1191 [Nitrosomonas nitrosa]